MQTSNSDTEATTMAVDQILSIIIGLLQIVIALLALWQNHAILRTTLHGKHLMRASKAFTLLILQRFLPLDSLGSPPFNVRMGGKKFERQHSLRLRVWQGSHLHFGISSSGGGVRAKIVRTNWQ